MQTSAVLQRLKVPALALVLWLSTYLFVSWAGRVDSELDALQRRIIVGGNLVFACVASWILWNAVRTAVAWRSGTLSADSILNRVRLFAPLAVVFAVLLGAWFYGEWPGHISTDQLRSLSVASRHYVEPWHSTLWGLWANAVTRVFGHFTVVGVINILAFAWIFADVLSLLWKRGLPAGWSVGITALIVTSIPFGLLAINFSHDILTAVAKIGLAALILRALLAQRAGDVREGISSVAVGFLILALSFLRGENIILLLAVPALLAFTRLLSLRRAAILLLCVALAHPLYRRVLEPMVNDEGSADPEFKRRYSVTLLLNPIGFMIANHYFSRNPELDRADVDRATDWECLKTADFHEPPCFWFSLKKPITEEKLRGLERVYRSSALNNPHLFLANRVATFLPSLGVSPRGIRPYRSEREDWTDDKLYSPSGAQLMHEQGMLVEREHPPALSILTRMLRKWSHNEGFRTPGYWIWNSVPAFALLLFVLMRRKTLPLSATLAAVFACPLALFFLAAPAAHLTYLADLYMFGFLLLGCWRFERLTAERARGDT